MVNTAMFISGYSSEGATTTAPPLGPSAGRDNLARHANPHSTSLASRHFSPRTPPILIVTPRDWKTLYLVENKHSRHVLIVIFLRFQRRNAARYVFHQRPASRFAAFRARSLLFLIGNARY
jgi:hypothetical protein